MKIITSSNIASYSADIKLKAETGETFKYFKCTSSVGELQAKQNVYREVVRFCKRTIEGLAQNAKSYWIDDHIQVKIRELKLTAKDFQKIINKIEPLIIPKVISERKEIEL